MQPAELLETLKKETARRVDVQEIYTDVTRSVAVDKNGVPVAVAFFDLDKTLLRLEGIHKPAIVELFPEVDPDGLWLTYFNGFKLGNSYREFDRIHRIFREGDAACRDPQYYLEMYAHIADGNGPDPEPHLRAIRYLQAYADIAVGRVEAYFAVLTEEERGRTYIAETVQLVKDLVEAGVLVVCMTANARPLAEAILKASGLMPWFFALETDESMCGSGKDQILRVTFECHWPEEIPVPEDRLILVGDSWRGDLDIIRLTHYRMRQGYLVLSDLEDLDALAKILPEDEAFRRFLNDFPVDVIFER